MAATKKGAVALACGAAVFTAAGTSFSVVAPTQTLHPATESLVSNAANGATASSGASASVVAAAAAAVSVGAALTASSKVLSRKRQGRVVMAAENPFTYRVERDTTIPYETFAGGLVGGESAFGGTYNFDPLGLSTKVPILLPWFREAELKHGRVAMVAFLGLIAPEFSRFPGHPCFSAPLLEAHNACIGKNATLVHTEPTGGPVVSEIPLPFVWTGVQDFGPMAAGLYICGFIEVLTTMAKATNITSAPGLTLESAGDYKLRALFPGDEAQGKQMRLKELKNGRLAMLAFAGAVTQSVLTQHGFPWLYAEKPETSAGLSSSVHSSARTVSSRGAVTRNAYKMSKAVPFLPLSPALEGMVCAEEEGFDPMGFSLALDIRWLREAEIKHGRVAMLATAGWIATDVGLRVPGKVFEVSTIDAHDALTKLGVMPHMLIWFGAAEFFSFLATIQMLEGNTDRQPGDFYLRTFYPSDAAGQYQMQLKELRNGRLAMLAIGGIATVAVETNNTWPFFDSLPLNAESSGVAAARSASTFCGAQAVKRGAGKMTMFAEHSASLPFLQKPKNLGGLVGGEYEFDPVCFSDFFDPKWLREAELKHGRVAMLASVGFLASQWITFPGLPAAENALQAPLTAPPSVMAALAFVVGFIESSSYGGKLTMLDMFKDSDREPGNFNFGSSFLNGKSEKDVKEMKMKELSNGRLAMFAIGGMIHHNLVVNGPLFPLVPDNWEGPFGTWQLNSVMSGLQEVYPQA